MGRLRRNMDNSSHAPGKATHVSGVKRIAIQVGAAGDAGPKAAAGQDVHQRGLSGAWCSTAMRQTRVHEVAAEEGHMT